MDETVKKLNEYFARIESEINLKLKEGFKERYVLAEGYPYLDSYGKHLGCFRSVISLDFPEEIRHSSSPKYRIVLEREDTDPPEPKERGTNVIECPVCDYENTYLGDRTMKCEKCDNMFLAY